MTRKRLALGVVGLWLVGLGLLARRELFPGEESRLERMAELVDPVTHYYSITRNGSPVGYASSQVDTSVFGVRVRNSSLTISSESDSARISTQYTAQLTPRLRLADFELSIGLNPNQRLLIGRTLGDSALELRTRVGTRGPADTVPFTRQALPPELAPFLIALGRTLRTGDSYPIELFDRETSSVSLYNVQIEAESLFTVADSAMLDSSTARFVPVTESTIPAWRVTLPGEGGGPMWIDRGGRIVMHELPGGFVLTRTEFELAANNWRLDRQAQLALLRGDSASADTNSLRIPPPIR